MAVVQSPALGVKTTLLEHSANGWCCSFSCICTNSVGHPRCCFKYIGECVCVCVCGRQREKSCVHAQISTLWVETACCDAIQKKMNRQWLLKASPHLCLFTLCRCVCEFQYYPTETSRSSLVYVIPRWVGDFPFLFSLPAQWCLLLLLVIGALK